jgi:hypothetical protein
MKRWMAAVMLLAAFGGSLANAALVSTNADFQGVVATVQGALTDYLGGAAGVVAGVGVVGLLIFLIVFLIRKSRGAASAGAGR